MPPPRSGCGCCHRWRCCTSGCVAGARDTTVVRRTITPFTPTTVRIAAKFSTLCNPPFAGCARRRLEATFTPPVRVPIFTARSALRDMNWRCLHPWPWLDTRARFIARTPRGGKLLDLGASDGETLRHIAELRPDLSLAA